MEGQEVLREAQAWAPISLLPTLSPVSEGRRTFCWDKKELIHSVIALSTKKT